VERPVVNEQALIDCSHENRIAGAALDVFDHGPLPAAHPFRSMDNVIPTSHIGNVTNELYRIYHGTSVANIRHESQVSVVRALTPAKRYISFMTRVV
jgi:phosphoglycerate dehydrogenase-like enzyme